MSKDRCSWKNSRWNNICLYHQLLQYLTLQTQWVYIPCRSWTKIYHHVSFHIMIPTLKTPKLLTDRVPLVNWSGKLVCTNITIISQHQLNIILERQWINRFLKNYYSVRNRKRYLTKLKSTKVQIYCFINFNNTSLIHVHISSTSLGKQRENLGLLLD